MSYNLQKKIIIAAFLFVPLALLAIFMVLPTFRLFQLSLTDWDGYSKTFSYIGLDNFKSIFLNSPDTWTSLRNNAFYYIGHSAAMPFEIAVASILCGSIRGTKYFKSIVFMPFIINGVAIALAFSFFFSPNGGLNTILGLLHLKALQQDWLGDIRIVNFAMVGVSLWRYCGQHVVFFIAGIMSIPREYYEAAEIDGANKLQVFWEITIPGIKTIIELLLFLNVRGILALFDLPFLLTNGGPGYESATFVLYSVKEAFTYNHVGLASALGVILMAITVGFYFLQGKIIKVRG